MNAADLLPDVPFLVVGRPPPEGRDLDLVVRAADQAEVTGHLAAAGFVERGGRWLRFHDSTVDVVDVTAVESWGLPDDEVAALFAQAVDARPAPAHVVLIEARRWTAGSVLTERRRARIDEALAGDGAAWDEVVRRAPAWGVTAALPVLRGEAPVQHGLRRVRRRLTRPRGQVVTLSGIDGSGKSSQVHALRDTLDRLGYPTATVWTRITINPSLTALGQPVKDVIAILSRRRQVPAPAVEVESEGRPPGHGVAPADPGQAFRVRHPAVNHAWITVVAVVNALAHWRAMAPHLAQGRVVVCDRYTLDSAVHLRYKYGPVARFRFQAGLVRWLSPRPLRSYLLDVPGAVAHARKPEKYTGDQLELLAELYREERSRLDVQLLDGQRPAHELAAAIADDVLQALLAARRASR